MSTLLTIDGPNTGQSFLLKGGSTILGRQHDSTICLVGKSISRHHAQILCRESAFLIEDLDSSNGTYLNGKRLKPRNPVPFSDSDTIQIGPYLFGLRPMNKTLMQEPNLIVRETVSALTLDPQILGIDPATKLQVVLEIAQQLGRTLDQDQLLEKLVLQIMRLFPHADRALVIMCEGENLVLRAEKTRRNDENRELPFSRTIVRRALEEGAGLLSDDVKKDQRFLTSFTLTGLDLHSVLCVPLITSEGKRLGAIQLDRFSKGLGFRIDDLQMLTAVAMQVAVVLENAALHAQRLKEERLHQELDLAREIQQGFLPEELEGFPQANFEIFGRVYPARTVAGDLYDFLRTPEGKLAFFLGDVSGKGMPAALFMVAVRTLCRLLAKEGTNPTSTLEKLHTALADDNPTCLFVTLIHGIFDPANREVVLTSAGHPSPMIRRANGAVEVMPLKPGRLLGYPHESSLNLTDIHFTMEPGDSLVMVTDGIHEARRMGDKAFFGTERWMETIRGFSNSSNLEIWTESARQQISQYTGSTELQDDVSLLILRQN